MQVAKDNKSKALQTVTTICNKGLMDQGLVALSQEEAVCLEAESTPVGQAAN